MQGRPGCLLQSAGGEANRILLASAFSSMRIICPNRVSRHDWIIAVSLGCFVSLHTSSYINCIRKTKKHVPWNADICPITEILCKTASKISLKLGNLLLSHGQNNNFCCAMLCEAYAVLQCLLVHLSRSRIMSKQINTSSKCFNHLVTTLF